MLKTIAYTTILTLWLVASSAPTGPSPGKGLVWPPSPDPARIEYVTSIDCVSLSPAGGFLKKLVRWIGGSSAEDELSLPFDVLSMEDRLFLVCQKNPALIEIDRASNDFTLHYSTDKDLPLRYPISICDGGDGRVFVSDAESRAVYRLGPAGLEPFVIERLVRPTGLAALPELGRLYVVDTGAQSLLVFDYDGNLLVTVSTETSGEPIFNYPSFASATVEGEILVNDGLNYQIKRFNSDGVLLSSFGREGDGPGSFSRPKGIAGDRDGHIYVVDNLFDNVQIFDDSGRVLLALGSAGSEPGQFWSPAGIDIAGDTIFVADTYNHRIQILHYLGAP